MLRTCSIAVLVLLLTLPAALAQEQPFDRMDVFDLEWVQDPQIAPDGEHVVYVRRGMDVMKDRRTSALWIMNADGTGHEKLTSREVDESSPRWSPDGTRIAFTSSTDDEGTEIFIHYADRHVTAKITQLEKSPSGIAWSPDGEKLAFSKLVPESEPQLVSPPEAPEGAE